MPYIPEHDRLALERGMRDAATPGELNYIFTRLALSYLAQGRNYQRFNDVVGALESCKLELYRRHIVPYEDEKIAANGDVPIH